MSKIPLYIFFIFIFSFFFLVFLFLSLSLLFFSLSERPHSIHLSLGQSRRLAAEPAGRSRESSCPNRAAAPPATATAPSPMATAASRRRRQLDPASTSSTAHPPRTKMENELLGRGEAGMSRYFWLLPGGEV
jgi:hypothetical protein